MVSTWITSAWQCDSTRSTVTFLLCIRCKQDSRSFKEKVEEDGRKGAKMGEGEGGGGGKFMGKKIGRAYVRIGLNLRLRCDYGITKSPLSLQTFSHVFLAGTVNGAFKILFNRRATSWKFFHLENWSMKRAFWPFGFLAFWLFIFFKWIWTSFIGESWKSSNYFHLSI